MRRRQDAVDKDLAERYRTQFLPGIPSDEFLFKTFKNIKRGPGFYWPTWVGLRRKAGGVLDLPEGIEGRVHLWSSPAVLVEDPPPSLNPLGHGDPRAQQVAYQTFMAKLKERFVAEPRQQAPLMCEVNGKFTSFFAGGDRPLRVSEAKELEAKKAAEAAEKAALDAGEKPGEKGEAEAQKPPPDPIGPKPPPSADAQEPEIEPERDMIAAGERNGRIVMIGDSDFLRDDLVRGDHARVGGPYSVLSGVFFSNMLDWLAEDRDLVELQARATTDRTMKFVDEPAPGADPRVVEKELADKTMVLRGFNIVAPILLLSVFGLVVFLMRRSQKRTFLETVG